MTNLERHRHTSSEDINFNRPRGQPRRSPGRSRSHHLFNERTTDAKDNEYSVESPEERIKSSSSLTQLTSGLSRKTSAKQAQREDTFPLVTYDGVVEDTQAENIHAHREVKVIVHKTSSSSSSTVSSVRSVEQRMTTSRGKHVRSRDQFQHHRHRHQNSREQWESGIENPYQSPSGFTVEKSSGCAEESIQLQVIDIAKDATNSEERCDTSQETIKEGGSLATMFDS